MNDWAILDQANIADGHYARRWRPEWLRSAEEIESEALHIWTTVPDGENELAAAWREVWQQAYKNMILARSTYQAGGCSCNECTVCATIAHIIEQNKIIKERLNGQRN